MKQISLGTVFEMSAKRTRQRVYLEEMERVVPWNDLVAQICSIYAVRQDRSAAVFG